MNFENVKLINDKGIFTVLDSINIQLCGNEEWRFRDSNSEELPGALFFYLLEDNNGNLKYESPFDTPHIYICDASLDGTEPVIDHNIIDKEQITKIDKYLFDGLKEQFESDSDREIVKWNGSLITAINDIEPILFTSYEYNNGGKNSLFFSKKNRPLHVCNMYRLSINDRKIVLLVEYNKEDENIIEGTISYIISSICKSNDVLNTSNIMLDTGKPIIDQSSNFEIIPARLYKDSNPRKQILDTFTINLPIKGSWGYLEDYPVIIDINDDLIVTGIPFSGIDIEKAFIKYRSLLELSESFPHVNLFENLGIILLEQELHEINGNKYDHIYYEIVASSTRQLDIAGWESGSKVTFKTECWFDITSFYGSELNLF